MRKLNLGPYELSDFKVTQQGDVVLVSYMVSAVETIKGQRLCKSLRPG